MRSFIAVFFMIIGSPAFADGPSVLEIVKKHVLPGYQSLSIEADKLAEVAGKECSAESTGLRAAYHGAFDAWVKVSHLRFGPSEEDDRAFALAFWPDPRSSTPKALAALIREQDAAVESAAEYATVSIAARGFYALEFLIFEPQFATEEKAAYQCALIQAVTTDIALNSKAILDGWVNGYAALMSDPQNDTYRSSTEAAQQLFTSLSTGLEFTSQTRLGRPMGSFEKPRPKRAEAWRSQRSLRHVVLSLEATKDLANLISRDDEEVEAAFRNALQRAADLNDPIFAGVSYPMGRFRVEVLQQSVEAIRQLLAEKIGPSLGIAAGFNSLDGD